LIATMVAGYTGDSGGGHDIFRLAILCQLNSGICIREACLLLPIASMAFHGGPMKVKPASVHFRANVGFSLSFALLSALVPLFDILTGNLRRRNPDVCPRNPPA